MSDELQLLIEKLVYGGDGLGHAEGNTVFVPYVLPNEEIRAEVTSRKKKLVWAKPLEILKEGAARTKPVCPHFGTCGGCHYQHVSYDSKVALNIAFKEFPKPVAELTKLFHGTVPALHSLLLLDQKKNRLELSGPGYLIQEAGGYQFRVSHLSFFQVNRFLVENLLRTVIAGAKGDLALDLYAGVGFFTLPLTKAFQRVVSVDANLSATRNLRENADTADATI